jgi:hypothetical protein
MRDLPKCDQQIGFVSPDSPRFAVGFEEFYNLFA